MAIKVRQDKNIKGLNISAECVLKLLLYADDVTMFLTDETDIEQVFKLLDKFKSVSGLQLNMSKTEAMWIGANRNKDDTFFDLKWVNEVRILGIYFAGNKSASEIRLNWQPKITQLKQAIQNWEKRNLGVLGKICVIKSLLVSQLVYAIQALSIPDNVLDEINTILYRFLWRKKNCNRKAFEKVKRVVVNSNIENGGISMIDIKVMQHSFLCQWFCKLSLSLKARTTWTVIPSMYFEMFGRDLACFNTSVKMTDFKGLGMLQSSFWKSVACSWLLNNKIANVESLEMTCLWNNSRIKCQNKVIFFTNWAKCGFTYVNDMLQENVIIPYAAVLAKLEPSPNLYLEYRTVHYGITQFLKDNPEYNTYASQTQSQLLFNGMKVTCAKSIRNYIVDQKYTIPCSVQFWKRKLNVDISDRHWKVAKQVTTESRLRELHWKILHNIYPSNILLHKMGLANNAFCTYCLNTIDYLEHFFFECRKIRHLWKHVEQIIFKLHGITILLNLENVLFGYIQGNM
jgi:hypothetical protein